jgi:hypothetical protein
VYGQFKFAILIFVENVPVVPVSALLHKVRRVLPRMKKNIALFSSIFLAFPILSKVLRRVY